jgi:hypothetical protein
MPPTSNERGNGDRPSRLKSAVAGLLGRKPAVEPKPIEPIAPPAPVESKPKKERKRSDAVATEIAEPSRTDINLVAQAARQEWLFTPAERQQLLGVLKGITLNSKFDRNRIAAAKAIALLMGLNLRQQGLDLAREKMQGGDSEFVLAEIVEAAERIALEHKPAERPTGEPK